MKRWLPALAFSLICSRALAQGAPPDGTITRANVASILGFEGAPSAEGLPTGWHSPGAPMVTLDTKIVHGGNQSARIERTQESPNTFTPISATIPVDFTGKSIELRGYLRVEDVKGHAALWLREDDGASSVAFINGDAENFAGTSDWKVFSLSLPIKNEAKSLLFGAFLAGTGKAWVDDLELLVDGKPIAATATRVPTVLESDKEFAAGSRITIDSLTDLQVENLATLAEVWGFLKYHHPAVASGQHNWDYDLFRIMPAILASRSPVERNARLLQWIDSLGAVPPCSPCVQLDSKDLQMKPDVAWIRDRARLGPALSARLQTIYARRPAGEQFYINLEPKVDNPGFLHEPVYSAIAFPDSGYQLLTLFRWWNAMEWWSPNRYLFPDWRHILRTYMRSMATAKSKQEFTLTIMKLIGEAHDTHANLWSSLSVRPPAGECSVAVALRFVGDRAVVWSVSDKASTLERGDVVERIDGRAVDVLVKEWSPFYADSNEAARKRDIASQMTNGPCGAVKLGIRRAGAMVEVPSLRVKPNDGSRGLHSHDLPGDTFHLLSKDIAYLKLSSVHAQDVDSYVQRASGTKGMIVDIRNYPSQFVVFALGQLLVEKPTVFVHFTNADLANPGAFHFVGSPTLMPAAPHYAGRIVLLVDETTQSQAEYTTMALRAAPGALVVGSQTAGADGNVSPILLPFEMRTLMSGLGVFTLQNGQTQQVGIARDIESVPTVVGIAAGRDEVLESGIRAILGDSIPQAELERMAHRE